MQYGSPNLKTLGPDGAVPETRIASAQAAQDLVSRLIDNDEKRVRKRARVNGLVDGNPPFSAAKLRDAGRVESCNTNWGTGRAYLEAGSGAFYDLATEAPGFFSVATSYGRDEEQRELFGLIMSQEADRILSDDPTWDYEIQQSQWNLVLHGCGPMLFEDPYCVLPRALQANDLLVPERTKSDLHYWEVCAVCVDYFPPQLYKFIRDEEAARAVGWSVEYTRRVIENAMDVRQPLTHRYDVEWYQQELKNNSLAYYDDSLVCKLAYVSWQEFDGTITQAIVERDTTTGTTTTHNNDPEATGIQYLFYRRGRYNVWTQFIHPFYFDRGNGGYHHSVTGLGVKMLSALTYENRLICDLMDKTSAPKILFKPTTSEVSQKFQMVRMGDYGILPANCDAVQNPIAGMLTDGLAMQRLASDLLRSNLSAYRQSVEPQKSGNPSTKYEKQLEASQQSSLSKTTYNRYYKQLDALFTEIANRLCDLNSPDERAKEFQKRCVHRGVPRECFGRIEKVEAVRVIGQGSSFMRKEAVNALLPVAASLPEEGRRKLISDKIAAEAGQAAVTRYNPDKRENRLANDQQSEAMQWVACMKIGVPPVITSSQNPVTFAATFLTAAIQAVQTVQQGAPLAEVVKFLDMIGPAIGAHLRRFANDPLRKSVFEPLVQQWKRLMAITDKLKKQLAMQQQQMKQQQRKTQAAMSEQALKAQRVQSDIQLRQAKTQAQLEQGRQKHQLKMFQGMQGMSLEDARTASQIHLDRMKAQADMVSEPAGAE